MNITVLDTLPGSGKTEFFIQTAKRTTKPVLYAAPTIKLLLSVATRLQDQRVRHKLVYGEGSIQALVRAVESSRKSSTPTVILTTHAALFESLHRAKEQDGTEFQFSTNGGKYDLYLDEMPSLVTSTERWPRPVTKLRELKPNLWAVNSLGGLYRKFVLHHNGRNSVFTVTSPKAIAKRFGATYIMASFASYAPFLQMAQREGVGVSYVGPEDPRATKLLARHLRLSRSVSKRLRIVALVDDPRANNLSQYILRHCYLGKAEVSVPYDVESRKLVPPLWQLVANAQAAAAKYGSDPQPLLLINSAANPTSWYSIPNSAVVNAISGVQRFKHKVDDWPMYVNSVLGIDNLDLLESRSAALNRLATTLGSFRIPRGTALHGLNDYVGHTTVCCLQALMPSPVLFAFYRTVFEGQEYRKSFMSFEYMLQALFRTALRDPKDEQPILLVVPTLPVGNRVREVLDVRSRVRVFDEELRFTFPVYKEKPRSAASEFRITRRKYDNDEQRKNAYKIYRKAAALRAKASRLECEAMPRENLQPEHIVQLEIKKLKALKAEARKERRDVRDMLFVRSFEPRVVESSKIQEEITNWRTNVRRLRLRHADPRILELAKEHIRQLRMRLPNRCSKTSLLSMRSQVRAALRENPTLALRERLKEIEYRIVNIRRGEAHGS